MKLQLLLSELVLQALGDGLGVAADGGGVQRAPERQDLGEQLGRQPVGDQARRTWPPGTEARACGALWDTGAPAG